MPFNPNVNDALQFDGLTYRVMEHPSARGMPYGQRGRQATVFKLQGDNGVPVALKVFIQSFRTATLVERARRLREFAPILGLKVCDQMVLTPERHGALLKTHPDLSYAVLMPWVQGETWQDILMGGQPFSFDQSQILATLFAGILAGMEERGVAHCDLSGPNVLIDLNSFTVALVDVEELYATTLSRPGILPSGTPGYAHRTVAAGAWGPEVDRFSGAVLLAEMLAWHDPRIQQGWFGEQFFDPNEMQAEGERFQLMSAVLRERWGPDVSEAFVRAWRSPKVADCPRLTDWLNLIAPRRGVASEEIRTVVTHRPKPTPPPPLPQPASLPPPSPPPPPPVESRIAESRIAESPPPAPLVPPPLVESRIAESPPPVESRIAESPPPIRQALLAARLAYCLSPRLDGEPYANTLLEWAEACAAAGQRAEASTAFQVAGAVAPPGPLRACAETRADQLGEANESDLAAALLGLALDMERADNLVGALMTYRRAWALTGRGEAVAALDFLKISLAAAQMFGASAKLDYAVPASVRHPASLVFLINLSQGFNAPLAQHILTSLVRSMAAKAARGSFVTPCYRLAIVGYHREVIDLLEGFKDIDRVDSAGMRVLPAMPETAAETGQAFEYVEKLLRRELTIHSTPFFPAPQILHLTGGRLTGPNPVRAALHLRALGQADGNVLLQTVWLGDELNGAVQDAAHWPGVKLGGPIAAPWPHCSSPVPGAVRALLRQAGYPLDPEAVMLWPGQQLKILTSLLPEVGEW